MERELGQLRISVTDLKKIARKFRLRGYSRLSKPDLIRFLIENVPEESLRLEMKRYAKGKGKVVEEEMRTVSSRRLGPRIEEYWQKPIKYIHLPVIFPSSPFAEFTDQPVELVNLLRQLDVPTLIKFCASSRELRRLCQQLPDIQYKINKAKVLKKGLNFINRDGEDIVARLYPGIHNITFIGRRIAIVPDEIKYLDELTVLNLSRNTIVSLPPSIGDLSRLMDVDLSYNQLTLLPPTIGELHSLVDLNLQHNLLVTLPDEIGDLSRLETLNVKENHLIALPDTIGDLTNLSNLNANVNQLTDLPASLENTPLTRLVLYRNRFTHFPTVISRLQNLELLSLYNNQLTTIPASIDSLTDLQELYLGHNRIRSLPSSIRELTNLRQLYIEQNAISRLPPSITQLSNLQVLDVNNNGLTELPLGIGQLTTLVSLNLADNHLIYLPPSFTNLTNLRSLNLERNPRLTLDPAITTFITYLSVLGRTMLV